MATFNVGKLSVLISANTKALEVGLTRAQKKAQVWAYKMQSVGAMMTKAFTVPLAIVAAGALKFSADFDKAMSKSIAIMGDMSDAQKNELERTARDVAKKTTFYARETADAYYYLASAGLDAAQSMKALPAVVAFATAGQFDLSRATDLLTDAQSALGLTVKDSSENMTNMVRVSDALVAANTKANASVEQFSEALTTKAGASMRMLGMDIEEGVSVLAAFADQGVKGAEAGTQFSIVLRDMQTKALQNADEFERLGVAVYDGNGEFRKMADILSDLERLMSGASDETKKATLLSLGFSDKSVAATQALIGLSDKIRQYEKDIRAAGGVTGKVATTQMQNLSDRFKILLGEANDLGITIGKALTPAAMAMADVFSGLIKSLGVMAEWFAQLPPSIRKFIGLVTAFVAAAGPMLWMFAKLKIAAVALGASLIALAANPFAAVVVGTAVLVAAFASVSTAAEKAKKSVDKFNEAKNSGSTTEKLAAYDSEIRRLQTIQKQYEHLIGRVKSQLSDPGFDDRVFGKFTDQKLRDRLRDFNDELNSTIERLAELQIEKGILVGVKIKPVDYGTGSAPEINVKNVEDATVAWDRLGESQKAFEEKAIANRFAMDDWYASLVNYTEYVGEASAAVADMLLSTFDNMARGIGDAVASAVVYGEDLGTAMLAVVQSVAAQIISTLIQLGIQQLISLAASTAVMAAETSVRMAAAAATTYASAYSAIIGPATLMSLFAGPAVAGGYAAGAVAQMMAGAAASSAGGMAFGAFAEGGIVTGPTLALIGEAGPEAVIPLGSDMGMGTTVIIEMDGRDLARVVVPHLGKEVRHKLGRII